MRYEITEFEPTPNPNALKINVEPSPTASSEGRPRSYFNPDAVEPGKDPLAERIFAIEGVTSLLIHTNFITVNKSPDAGWGPIKKALAGALEDGD